MKKVTSKNQFSVLEKQVETTQNKKEVENLKGIKYKFCICKFINNKTKTKM